ncbi:MAG: YtxH domain-containing protein [Bacteroidota bacterium]
MNKITIALLAGFVAGILLAPDKGSVTRKKLNDGFDDLSDKLSDLRDKFTPAEDEITENVVIKISAGV